MVVEPKIKANHNNPFLFLHILGSPAKVGSKNKKWYFCKMKNDEIYKELASYLLPEGILDYFDLVEVKKVGIYLNIYLEEQEKIPEEYSNEPYRNNGFMNEIQIKDFPIRDQLVTLYVKRRRWLLTEKGQKVRRDWTLVAPGTRMTKDLAAFLKELVR